MAGVTFMATADEGTTARWSAVGGTVAISSTYARTGTYSYKFTGNTTYLSRYVTSSATCPFVRVALRLNTSQICQISFRESATVHLNLYIETIAGTVAVRTNTAVLATYAAGIVPNTWYCFELSGTIHDSTGTTSVKINGVAIAALTLTGQDTRNAGTSGVCDNVLISNISTGDIYVDDVMFRDDQLPGQGGIYLGTAVADDDVETDWTASELTAPECVDEIPATFTNYIYELNSAAGDRHFFTTTGLPDLEYSAISGVGVIAYAKLSETGSGTVKAGFIDGATGLVGSAVSLDVSGVYVEGYWTGDVDSHAWVEAQINALTVGVEVGALP